MPHPQPPKLDKPGAGLPWPQRWFIPLIVPRMARKATWEESVRIFDSQARKILALVEPLGDEAMDRRVLAPRLRGLEDSSRYWSVAMTLEHLIIVSDLIAETIVLLSQGTKPGVTFGTADVKPRGAVGGAKAKQEFERMIERVRKRVSADVKDRGSPVTHPHPWFGEFTAHQWNWLLGSHFAIHKAQIKAILEEASR